MADVRTHTAKHIKGCFGATQRGVANAAWRAFYSAFWAILLKTDAFSIEDFDDEWELVCMAYEVGVLLLPPKPIRHALPWCSPAEPYDPTVVRPFSSQRFLNVASTAEMLSYIRL